MFILRGRGGVTAKKLAEELRCGCSRFRVPREERFVVNFGSQFRGEMLNGKVISNKLEVSYLLSKNKIRTPNVWERGEEIPDNAFPLLARKKYHTQGKDVIYIHNREELARIGNNYDYLIQYVDKISEYRVHVLGDYKVMVTVKIPIDEKSDPIVRAKKNGWKQVSYDREYYEELVELGKKVIETLNYDFGAIDIIRKGDRLYTLEVNSAPGLETRKLKEYCDYFKNEEKKWKERNV